MKINISEGVKLAGLGKRERLGWNAVMKSSANSELGWPCSWATIRARELDFTSPCRFFTGSKGHKLGVKTIPGEGLSHLLPFPEAWEMSASEGCVCRAGETIYLDSMPQCPLSMSTKL